MLFGYGKSSKKLTFFDLCSRLVVVQESFANVNVSDPRFQAWLDSPGEGALVHPKWTSTCAGGCRRGGGARREFLHQGTARFAVCWWCCLAILPSSSCWTNKNPRFVLVKTKIVACTVWVFVFFSVSWAGFCSSSTGVHCNLPGLKFCFRLYWGKVPLEICVQAGLPTSFGKTT